MRWAAVAQGWQVDERKNLVPTCLGVAVGEAGIELLVGVRGVGLHAVD
jgi:hypothetical protein